MAQTVIIADDHPLFRGALRQAVTKTVPDAAVAEASSLKEARQAIEATDAILLCLDLHMHDSQGFAGLIAFRHDLPALPVVVVSASDSPDVMRRAIEFGAAGFIPKSSSLEQISKALESILQGDVWLPPQVDGTGVGEDPDAARLASLTPTQLRVLVAMSEGKLNKQIAYEMSISEATVKAHVTAVLRKLNVVNRTQAVLAARALQVEPEPVANDR